ncbi:MAG: hydantoinase B/oxoprolinase family protein [bacterium]|nr:hydantoinase B/oxoprolinase family protein [bacterium]
MSQGAPPQVDPVTTEVIRNAFISIASQMNNNLARSAYTPIIYEMKDCSVGLFNQNAELLGQAPGLPIFLGSLEAAINATTEHFGGPEIYRPGDVYAVNDSYLVGSHLNDVSVFSPIFYGGELVGFGATKAHWMDIGAKDPSQTNDATSIYEEGYRLGPTHLYREGRPETGVLQFITRNSRLPRSIWGDLHAQIAACRTGERQLGELMDRFGRATVEEAAEVVFEQCERLDREAVAAIADGTFVTEGQMDSWGPGGGPVYVRATVTVEGDEMVLDLDGSSPQTPGCMNCGFAQTVAAACLAYKLLINPEVPVTGGTFRNLRVLAPEASIFDAREPTACQYYFPHLGLMIDLFISALASGMPEKVVAAQPADPMNVLFVGKDPETGDPFVTGEATAVGWGAWSGGDGTNGMINYGGGDLKNIPVEVLESRYPIRVHQYAVSPDSGGRGRWRGGLGVVREYEVLADGVTLSTWFERTTTRAWGLFGGEPGGTTDAVITVDGESTPVLKVNRFPAPAGSRLRVVTGGGGGYGDPAERSEEDLRRDLIEGYTTVVPPGLDIDLGNGAAGNGAAGNGAGGNGS